MAWEERGAGTYYYRKERRDGRVCSVYVGGGIIAALAAQLDVQTRREVGELKLLIDEERGEERKVIAACRRLREAVRETLTAAGFHQHKGQWRRRRMAKVSAKAEEENALARAALAECELLAQALLSDDPSPSAKALVACELDKPGGWREVGDLMGEALKTGVEKAGCSYYDREALKGGVEEMRIEMNYARASLPERLLIEQVLLCWLRLGVLERAQTRAMTGSHQYIYLNYLESATTLAQRRYTNAIQALARVRRLLQPRATRVQVNALVVADAQERQAIALPPDAARRLED